MIGTEPTSACEKVSLWDSFATAVQFLTRIPIPGPMQGTPTYYQQALSRSVVFFPLVGSLVGVLTAASALAASQVFSPLVCGLIAIGLETLITGAFHEDGFADSWDALGGGWTRERVLEIMKDSRLGTYGTTSLIIGLGLRVATTAALLPSGWLWTLASIVAASTLGRVAILGMMISTEPIPGRDSHAKDISGTQSWKTLIVAVVMTWPMWGIWIWLSPIVAGATLAVVVLALWRFRKTILVRVGGTTGDLLGCSAFLTQLIVLIGSTWRLDHA